MKLIVFSMFGDYANPYLDLGLPTTHIQISARPGKVDIAVDTHLDGHFVRELKTQVARVALPVLQAEILKILRDQRDDALIVYLHEERVYPGVADLILASGIPYVFGFDEKCRMPWSQRHFVGSARDRICFKEDAQDVFKRSYLFDCDVIQKDDEATLLDRLKRCGSRERLVPLERSTSSKNHNVLLLSYYYSPALTVAVHRVRFWKENMARVAKEALGASAPNIQTQVLTACESYQNDTRNLVVPDRAQIDAQGTREHVVQSRLAAARVNWTAVYWSAHIRRWFEQHPDAHFDTVIMSGNPFFYFGLSEYFKERFGAKVILDFRDPFANNPRFTYSIAHKSLVEELEDNYLDTSDAALAVNTMCLRALRLLPGQKSAVIANGFDESVVDEIKPKPIPNDNGRAKFIYTGKFYADRDASALVKAMNPDKHRFLHIGWQSDADDHLDDYPAMERLGVMDYPEVVAHCKSADAGVIFASGDAFEQTTKIFDYLAADIDIIIVTDGAIEYGNLHEMTADLDGIYWVRNTERGIAKFVKNYTPKRRRRPQRARFSRGAATENLVRLMLDKD